MCFYCLMATFSQIFYGCKYLLVGKIVCFGTSGAPTPFPDQVESPGDTECSIFKVLYLLKRNLLG